MRFGVLAGYAPFCRSEGRHRFSSTTNEGGTGGTSSRFVADAPSA
jgi:hypothetical protein